MLSSGVWSAEACLHVISHAPCLVLLLLMLPVVETSRGWVMGSWVGGWADSSTNVSAAECLGCDVLVMIVRAAAPRVG